MFLAHSSEQGDEVVAYHDQSNGMIVAGANPLLSRKESDGEHASGFSPSHATGHFHQAARLRQSTDTAPRSPAGFKPAPVLRQGSSLGNGSYSRNSATLASERSNPRSVTPEGHGQGVWRLSRHSSGSHLHSQGSGGLHNQNLARSEARQHAGQVNRFVLGSDQHMHQEVAEFTSDRVGPGFENQGSRMSKVAGRNDPVIIEGELPLFLPGFLDESGMSTQSQNFQKAVRKVIAMTWVLQTGNVTFNPACKYCQSELFRMHKQGFNLMDCLHKGFECRFCRNALVTSGKQDIRRSASGRAIKRDRGDIQADIQRMKEIAHQKKRELKRSPSWVEEHRAKLLKDIQANNEKFLPKSKQTETVSEDSSSDSLEQEYEEAVTAHEQTLESEKESTPAHPDVQKIKSRGEMRINELRDRRRHRMKKLAVQDLDSIDAPREEPIPLQGITKATVRRIVSHTMVLNQLTEDEIEELLKYVVMVRYPCGYRIIKQGEEDDTVFSVVEGHVDVYQDKQWCDRIESGGVFGEISIVQNVPRTATVTATAPVICMEFAGDVLDFIFRHRKILWTYMMVLAEERIEDNKRHLPRNQTISRLGSDGIPAPTSEARQTPISDAAQQGSHGEVPSFPNVQQTSPSRKSSVVADSSRRSSMVSLSDTDEAPNAATLGAPTVDSAVAQTEVPQEESDSNVFALTKLEADQPHAETEFSIPPPSDDNEVSDVRHPKSPANEEHGGEAQTASPTSPSKGLWAPQAMTVSITDSRQVESEGINGQEGALLESQSKGMRGQLQAALDFSAKYREPPKKSLLTKDLLSFFHSRPIPPEANQRPGSRESGIASWSGSRPGSRDSFFASAPLMAASRRSAVQSTPPVLPVHGPDRSVPIEIENGETTNSGQTGMSLPDNIIPPISVHVPVPQYVSMSMNSPLARKSARGDMSPGPLFGWADSSPPSPTSQEQKRHFNSVRKKLLEENSGDRSLPPRPRPFSSEPRPYSSESSLRSKTSLGINQQDGIAARPSSVMNVRESTKSGHDQSSRRTIHSATPQHRINSMFGDQEAANQLEQNIAAKVSTAKDCHVFELKVAIPTNPRLPVKAANGRPKSIKKGQCHTAFLLCAASVSRT